MKNFSITKDGTEYWVSRSVAVVVLLMDNTESHIIAVKRGTGTPDPEYVGKWCLPCGYLDWDEDIHEAAKREVFEETGIDLTHIELKITSIKSDPTSDKRQNVSIILTGYYPESCTFSTENSEPNEVAAIGIIARKDISNYKWAFAHDKLIEEYLYIKN